MDRLEYTSSDLCLGSTKESAHQSSSQLNRVEYTFAILSSFTWIKVSLRQSLLITINKKKSALSMPRH